MPKSTVDTTLAMDLYDGEPKPGCYRARRCDANNIILECYEVISPKEGPKRLEWVMRGYYGTLKHALQGWVSKAGMDESSFPKDLRALRSLWTSIGRTLKALSTKLDEENV